MTKAERKEILVDQIKTAKYAANTAVKYNPEDGKWFTYDETVSMFLAKAIKRQGIENSMYYQVD